MPTTSDRGLFVWHEVSTRDVQSSEAFYTQLMGWKSEPWNQNPSYKILTARKEARAGIWTIVDEANGLPAAPHWLCYIGTPDVDATVRLAVELGGKVAVPAYNVPRVGRMAHLHDPQGAVFAVTAMEQRQKYLAPEQGDFSWHELLTTNILTAFEFYSKLFGWERMTAHDMGPQGTYQIFGAAGQQLGGLFNPGGFPPGGPQWLPYAMVRDARRSSDVTQQLGGTLTLGPMEVPGGDWVFTAIDPQGALFGVHSTTTTKGTTNTTKDTKTTTKGTKNTMGTTKNTKSTKRTTKGTKGTKKGSGRRPATSTKSAKKRR